MPETGELETTAVARPSKRPLMIGLVLSLLGATAGFYTMWSGLIPLGGGHEPVAEAPVEGATDPGLPTVELAFVPVVPVVVSVGQGAARSHLRFAAELEVNGRVHAGAVKGGQAFAGLEFIAGDDVAFVAAATGSQGAVVHIQ